MATWRVTEDDGGYFLRRNRERKSRQFVDLDEVLHSLRGQVGVGDRVLHVQPDGYEVVITRQVAGKHRRR